VKLVVWGTGTPRREFLYADDLAQACCFLMNLDDARYGSLLSNDNATAHQHRHRRGCNHPAISRDCGTCGRVRWHDGLRHNQARRHTPEAVRRQPPALPRLATLHSPRTRHPADVAYRSKRPDRLSTNHSRVLLWSRLVRRLKSRRVHASRFQDHKRNARFAKSGCERPHEEMAARGRPQ
jgi:hypothetical protein